MTLIIEIDEIAIDQVKIAHRRLISVTGKIQIRPGVYWNTLFRRKQVLFPPFFALSDAKLQWKTELTVANLDLTQFASDFRLISFFRSAPRAGRMEIETAAECMTEGLNRTQMNAWPRSTNTHTEVWMRTVSNFLKRTLSVLVPHVVVSDFIGIALWSSWEIGNLLVKYDDYISQHKTVHWTPTHVQIQIRITLIVRFWNFSTLTHNTNVEQVTLHQ